MSSPAVLTVAIPFYDNRALLAEAVESVRQQTRDDWRLLVCDDSGKPGDLADWLASFDDPRIRYLGGEQSLGMAGNWNRCLDSAGTELVTLLHGDDRLLPDYCAMMSAAARSDPGTAAFFCRARIIGDTGRRRFSFPDAVKRILQPRNRQIVLEGEPGAVALCRGNFIMCPTLCFRLSRVGTLRFSHRWKFALDLDFTLRLLLAGERLVGLPQAGYAYRRHRHNATQVYTQSGLRFREEIALHNEFAKAARAEGWARAARTAESKRMIRLHLGYQLMHAGLRFRWGMLRQSWQLLRQARCPGALVQSQEPSTDSDESPRGSDL